MITNNVKNQVLTSEGKYRAFMNLETFPSYELQAKEVSLLVADKQGFDSIARTLYSPDSDSHTLIVSTNLCVPEYVLFHEFTHILDAELYAKKDKTRYASLSGFTEFHASQVELMRLLNADSITSDLPISKNAIIETVSGIKSVSQYINDKFTHAYDLFSRPDFPASIETLIAALGVLYNYFGLRSIYKMFSSNSIEARDYSPFLKHIPTVLFDLLNSSMQGWLTPAQIDVACTTYPMILIPIINKYKLV